jgi:hypothetical protein
VHNIPKRPRRGLYVAAAIGAVVVGAGIAALTLRDPSPATAEPTPPPVATEPVAPTPTPTPAPAPAPTPPPAPVEVPLPVLPEKVTLVLESDPPGATVFVGEEKLGETPHSYDTVRGEEPLRFRFEKPGFEPRWKDITPRAGQAVSVALAPLPSAKPSGETKRRPKSPRSGDKPAPPRGGVDDDLLAPQ